MIAFHQTIGQLIKDLEGYRAVHGDSMPCGAGMSIEDVAYIDMIQVEWVFIERKTGRVVGDDANDYQPKEGECAALRIS